MNVGLVGIGPWGQNYIKTFRMISDANLRWICSPNRKIEQGPAGSKFTNNYHDLLNDEKIKGIIIATPPATHYELAKKALLAGKNVLLEKPMTLSSREALELHKLSLEKSLVLMVGHTYRYNPATIELKRIVDEGEFGRLLYIHSNRSDLEPSRNDIGVMWDFAPHDISIMNYLTGQTPVEVNTNEALNLNVKNVVNISLVYQGNFNGFIHNSWAAQSKIRRISVVGKEKSAVFDDLLGEKLVILDKQGKGVPVPISNKRSPLELQCLHFLECIEKIKKPLTNGYDGYVNVCILEAVQKSIDTGKKIEIIYS